MLTPRSNLMRWLVPPPSGPGTRELGARPSRATFGMTLALALGCGTPSSSSVGSATRSDASALATPPSACLRDPVPATEAPDVRPRHRDPEFWIRKLGPRAEEVLLDDEAITRLNASAFELVAGPRDLRRPSLAQHEHAATTVDDRTAHLEAQLREGSLVVEPPDALEAAKQVVAGSTPVDHQRLVLRETPLRCVPADAGFFKPPVDPDFDRNACSSLHPGERVRVLRRGPAGDWLYLHTGYAVGWARPGGLGPRLDAEALDAWDSAPRLVSRSDALRTEDGFPLRLGVSVPLIETRGTHHLVRVPSDDGLREAKVLHTPHAHLGDTPFTRADLLRTAFGRLGDPYGWGGRAGHRDCSRYLRDLLATTGLQLGRHSGVQALQGSLSLDVEGWTEADKLRALETWNAEGLVLLYMPGHVMLYLGEDDGQHYALSAISEWLEPCPGGPDTVRRIDRVAVTTLELGRGTVRTAFLERLTRLAIFAPGIGLLTEEPVAEARDPAQHG